MDLTDTIDKEFSQLAFLADDRIDLAHGALLIATAAYPDLNKSSYLERLDQMASRVKLETTANTESEEAILNEHLGRSYYYS